MQLRNLRSVISNQNKNIADVLEQSAQGKDWSASFRAGKLLELVRYLESRGPEPVLHASISISELWIHLTPGCEVCKIWVDWYDRQPLVNGMPKTHFRGKIGMRDFRTAEPAEVERLLLTELGLEPPA
jgi:hypothetical protein